jgi:hypothetical protein
MDTASTTKRINVAIAGVGIGIFTGHVLSALWVLAVMNNVAALQRMLYVVKQAHQHHSVEET